MRTKLSIFCLAFLLFIFQQGLVSAGGQQCQCSKVQPEKHKQWERMHSRRHRRRHRRHRRSANSTEAEAEGTETEDAEDEESDDRIVGGYNTEHMKPWAAKLWVVKKSFLCGATLINKRYLITAAHCTCKMLPCVKGKPTYDPSQELAAYLGLNNKVVEFDNIDIKGNAQYEYGVEAVKSHPEYKLSSDIALVKLDRDVKFVPGHLEPICLPTADDKSDVPETLGEVLDLYVAGWGHLRADCTTNEFGPVKNLKCKFPFTFNGKTHDSCSRTRSPSSKLDECKAFKKANPKAYPKVPGDNILIEMDGGKKIKCYSYDTGNDGWCQAVDTDDQTDDNWGWCQTMCDLELDSVKRLALQLQETHLEILPLSHCKELITSNGYIFIGKYEICAGRKKKFKSTKVFKKTGEGQYTESREEINYLGLNDDGNYKYDYYVAGTDSCNGDSGGPAYRWIDGVPTLVGIVARGFGSDDKNGCAELNYPGIYTRIAKFLDWIKENTQDGLC